LDNTSTGRLFCDDKSVNGRGTSNMSPWLYIVPHLIINLVVPKICTGYTQGFQILV